MRGTVERSGQLFSYVDLEARERSDHPLRSIRAIVNDALATLAPNFVSLYSKTGRPSIVRELLLRAMLLEAFYTVRCERQLKEWLDTDLLFRWFVGLSIDDKIWDDTVFSKNLDRLPEGATAAKFLAAVLSQSRVKKLMSSDHFSVDGTLIEAWASSGPKTVRVTSLFFREFLYGALAERAPRQHHNLERHYRGERAQCPSSF